MQPQVGDGAQLESWGCSLTDKNSNNKILGKKMTCKKTFLVKKMSGKKKCLVHNDFGPKILGPKKFGLKKFGSKQNYHLKKMPQDF